MPKPISITRKQLEALGPCDLPERLALFGKRRSLNVAQALEAGASAGDVLWVLGRLGRKDLCVAFAIGCAKRAQPAQPSAEALAAIAAAEAWLADPSEENATAARAYAEAAAYAAEAAAYAAEAARAAAEAARAAAYAAYAAYTAATYAAYAAARAATYVAYAATARAAELQAQRDSLVALTSGQPSSHQDR